MLGRLRLAVNLYSPRGSLLKSRMHLPLSDHIATVRLGRSLRRAHLSRGLSQRAVAAEADLVPATVAGLEKGRGTVQALLRVLSLVKHRFWSGSLLYGCGRVASIRTITFLASSSALS